MVHLFCSAAKSTTRTLQSDEPFTIRDIQFKHPDIGILTGPSRKILGYFIRFFSILYFRTVPCSGAVKLRHALKNPRVCAILDQDDKNCPGFALTFVQHRGEAARRFDGADQSANLKMGGDPRIHPLSPARLRSRPGPKAGYGFA